MAWGEGERGAGPAQRCQYVEVSVAEAALDERRPQVLCLPGKRFSWPRMSMVARCSKTTERRRIVTSTGPSDFDAFMSDRLAASNAFVNGDIEPSALSRR